MLGKTESEDPGRSHPTARFSAISARGSGHVVGRTYLSNENEAQRIREPGPSTIVDHEFAAPPIILKKKRPVPNESMNFVWLKNNEAHDV